MQFFKLKDYLRSWSVWVLGSITVSPVLNDQFGIFNHIVPTEYQPMAVSLLGALGLVVRAIKQKP